MNPAYIPLFHEIHAACFRALVSITNDLLRGKRMSRSDLFAALPDQDPSFQEETAKLLDSVFLFDEKGYAYQNKWLKYKNEWYYFDNDCKMVTNKVFKIDEEGKMKI